MTTFREACLSIVLEPSCSKRIYGAEACGRLAAQTNLEECAAALDKRAQVKETWPGVGALMHAMEDEYPTVRVAGIKAIGAVAKAHPRLLEQCVKLMLEGLQDSSTAVRLQAVRVALDCKPKRVEAPELRLLLETLTSDESEEVKEAILKFFIDGSSFSESSHAGIVAEWLASLEVCSDSFLFVFGVTHANLLYHCATILETTRPAYRSGVLIVFAGVASVWGVPIIVNDPTIKRDVLRLMEEFSKRSTFLEDAEYRLNKAIITQSVDDLEGLDSAKAFIKEFLSVSKADQNSRESMLRYWSGFDQPSWVLLKKWAVTGTLGGERLAFDAATHLINWEDSLPPRNVSFEISYQTEAEPVSDIPFGIARLRVFVRAKHLPLNSSASVHTDGTNETYHLEAREKSGNLVTFKPITIAYPFTGKAADNRPNISVRLL